MIVSKKTQKQDGLGVGGDLWKKERMSNAPANSHGGLLGTRQGKRGGVGARKVGANLSIIRIWARTRQYTDSDRQPQPRTDWWWEMQIAPTAPKKTDSGPDS